VDIQRWFWLAVSCPRPGIMLVWSLSVKWLWNLNRDENMTNVKKEV
jgi:hypothetical protein